MLIDSHAHLKHGDAAKTKYSAKAIVFAMSTTTRRSIEMAEAAVEQFPDRLIPYVYALPSYERPVIEELDAALRGKRFRGIKIHAGECRLREYIIDPVFTMAAKHGAPCLVDTRGDAHVARRLAAVLAKPFTIGAHEITLGKNFHFNMNSFENEDLDYALDLCRQGKSKSLTVEL